MQKISIVLILLTIVTALAQITDRIRIPYPILLVLAGIGIGLVPGLPAVSLDPEIVFLIFLPPVLYAAAWTTSWPEFKAAIRPISLLAVGCVLFTTTAVAIAAHYFIPGFDWPEAFVLGAIISPPDAVAATAATKGLGVPKRITTILEGESLVNDATGLIALRYAIAAAGTGTFVFWLASFNFFYVAGVGILIGFLVGVAFYYIHKLTPDNATTDTTLTFVTPYAAYLMAESIHASGVLAVVIAGLYLSPRSSVVFGHQTRLQAYFVWDTIMFILNGLIFILIGLQLPIILSNIKEYSFWTVVGYASLISLVTIVARLVWVYPGTYLPRWISKGIREREDRPSGRLVTVVAWSGMRGVVSLAAALALPFVVSGGQAFPHRDLIIFITFGVIFATLVLQGLTLPPLIRWLKIKSDGKTQEEEKDTRVKVAAHVIEHIEENYLLSLSDGVLNQIKSKYEMRIQKIRKDESEEKMNQEQIREFLAIQQALLHSERAYLLELRKKHAISDETVRKLEYELDLEQERLNLESNTND